MSLGVAECVGLVVGLLLGSFLNVCIVRVPRGESVVRTGSRCGACGKPVRWFDNVPVVSWLVLRGRCRDCGVGFGWRYLGVEVVCGLWFWLLAARFWYVSHWDLRVSDISDLYLPANTILYTGLSVLGFLLIGLIVTDWRTQRLPDAFTLTGIATGMFLVCVQAVFLGPTDDQVVLNSAKQLRLSSPGSFVAKGNVFLTGPEALIFGRLAAICGAALVLLLVRWAYKALRGREGLGLGDVKLLAMVAAFLGWWPAVLTLFLGTMLAAGFAVVLLVRGRAGAGTRLAFGELSGGSGAVYGSVGGWGDRVVSGIALGAALSGELCI